MTALIPMSTIESSAGQEQNVDDAELAAAAFLARYQGRTLDAYRYDLRAYFQWTGDEGLVILSATRPQIELYVRAMERRGLAATTIDRRLSTVLRLLPVAHIDGRIASNPAQYVRRPKVHPNDARGLDRWELGAFPLSERSEETEHVVVVFCRNELVCEGSHCGELTLCVGADPIRTSGDMGGGRAEPRVDLDAGGRKCFRRPFVAGSASGSARYHVEATFDRAGSGRGGQCSMRPVS